MPPRPAITRSQHQDKPPDFQTRECRERTVDSYDLGGRGESSNLTSYMSCRSPTSIGGTSQTPRSSASRSPTPNINNSCRISPIIDREYFSPERYASRSKSLGRCPKPKFDRSETVKPIETRYSLEMARQRASESSDNRLRRISQTLDNRRSVTSRSQEREIYRSPEREIDMGAPPVPRRSWYLAVEQPSKESGEQSRTRRYSDISFRSREPERHMRRQVDQPSREPERHTRRQVDQPSGHQERQTGRRVREPSSSREREDEKWSRRSGSEGDAPTVRRRGAVKTNKSSKSAYLETRKSATLPSRRGTAISAMLPPVKHEIRRSRVSSKEPAVNHEVRRSRVKSNERGVANVQEPVARDRSSTLQPPVKLSTVSNMSQDCRKKKFLDSNLRSSSTDGKSLSLPRNLNKISKVSFTPREIAQNDNRRIASETLAAYSTSRNFRSLDSGLHNVGGVRNRRPSSHAGSEYSEQSMYQTGNSNRNSVQTDLGQETEASSLRSRKKSNYSFRSVKKFTFSKI